MCDQCKEIQTISDKYLVFIDLKNIYIYEGNKKRIGVNAAWDEILRKLRKT